MDGTRDPAPSWQAAEVVLAAVLASVEELAGIVSERGLWLSYLPFTGVGPAEEQDLSWEACAFLAGADVGIGLGGTPADALRQLVDDGLDGLDPDTWDDAPVVTFRDRVAPGARSRTSARARALGASWSGWSGDLQRLAEFAASAPAVSAQPAGAGFDVRVAWGARVGDWEWTVSTALVDATGDAVGLRRWTGSTPADALGSAWDARRTWYRPG